MRLRLRPPPAVVAVAMAILVAGCSSDSSGGSAAPASPAPAAAYTPVTIDNCGTTTTFTEAPERIVMVQNSIETVLALGLGDKVVGYSLAGHGAGDLPADLAAQLATLKNLGNDINKEALVGVEPDLVIGPYFAFTDANGTTRPQLDALGITSHHFYEVCQRGAPSQKVSFDTIGAEILTLGRIFGVEGRAQELVADIKASADNARARVASSPKLKVLVYDSGEDSPFTAGGVGIENLLIEAAGGTNIFADLTERSFMGGTWEQVVERNPDVILINDYTDPEAPEQTLEHKRDFLLSFPALQSVTAVKNKAIISVKLNDVFLSAGNGRTAENIARQLHPQAF